MSKIKLKNNIDTEFSIEHIDNAPAIYISSTRISMLTEDNLKNLADGTLPTDDPLVAGKLWNNNGVVSVSTGS